MAESRRQSRIAHLIAPALLVVLPLCLFGPYTIFSGNETEFSAPFWVLVRPLLMTGAALALVLAAVGVMLPRMLFRPYVVLLFAVGLVLWIQGSFLVADYGSFTGADIDWARESWRNPYEIALWIGGPLLAVVGTRYLFRIAPFASGVLVALQAAALIVAEVRADSPTPKWQGPSESMFELSRTHNVLHIVLDGYQSDLFGEILAEERPAFDRSLSGAVFFANHSGAFPTTIVSIPAMLTGRVYRNDRPLQSYVRDTFTEGSLFKSLRAAGYRVDSVGELHFDNEWATNYYRLPRPYVSYDDYTHFTTWQLADLSLFRHAPHVLRPAIYNNQSWRLQTTFGPGDTSTRRYHPVNGAVVLDEFARRLTPATDEPVYKFIHVGIPHQPVTVNAKCEFIGVVRSLRAAYKEQARCAIGRAAQILDRLKEVGVYDNTLVVISSDHGIGYVSPTFTNERQLPPRDLGWISAKALALLIVKPPHSQGPVRISNAPTTITDIPATILAALGIAHDMQGQPALTLDEHASRTRPWAYYDWEHEDWGANYFDSLDIMDINGPVLDGKSWTLKDSIYAPTAGPEARSRGVYATQRSRSGTAYRWASPHASFHAPPDARQFEITIRSIAPQPQTVTFTSEGRVMHTVTLSNQSWVTVKQALPAPTYPRANWLELTVDPPWRPRGEVRTLGVQTRDLIFRP
jgi:hypothetical protein